MAGTSASAEGEIVGSRINGDDYGGGNMPDDDYHFGGTFDVPPLSGNDESAPF